ncbi:MAG: UDP-N-acetylmuramoyl-L-alanyl-D-glutamate--2,6-diaminopimelate ligase [Betaproteobacteria bacterium]|nr:UDP-N-acetylmuramoyl-L-alanyl-D-glutamate--2,6-diaminopimelate ligase [Betaproteobacteria bacterium]
MTTSAELLGRLAALGVHPRSVTQDSRDVGSGDLFLAFPGGRFDGRDYIGQAVDRGACAVIWDTDGCEWPAARRIPNLGVSGLRELAGAIAAHVYGHPARELWVAGVTGTNGKTSCTHWIAEALGRCGTRAAVVGTLGNGFPGELGRATHTTPDPVALQRELRRLRTLGARAIAMEVSSHALDQGRVDDVRFATALFTNLTRDHLDYHGSMEAYAEAKARLFSWPDLANAIINVDDRFGRDLVTRVDRNRTRVLGYGIGRGDIAAHEVKMATSGLALRVTSPWGEATLSSRMIGGFNVGNLLGSLGVLMTAEVPLPDAVAALSQVSSVPGRIELLRTPGAPLVVVDYAHTPDALEKVLETLRELVGHDTGARLVCVFGCGGERDPGKRPVMGEIATRLADFAIITNDNPRGEDPRAIAEQIVAGSADNHEVILDRERAIAQALSVAREADVILIAGKGHEAHQDIGGRRFPFNDLQVARRLLDARSPDPGARDV